MDYSKEIDVDHQRFVDATINVLNATNFTSSIEVRGFQGINIDGITMLIGSKQVKPRSYAFICTQNDAKVKSQQKPLIEFGKRMPGDFLIRYRRDYSENGKIYFNFHDPYIKLTHIIVYVDVRICDDEYEKANQWIWFSFSLVYFTFSRHGLSHSPIE